MRRSVTRERLGKPRRAVRRGLGVLSLVSLSLAAIEAPPSRAASRPIPLAPPLSAASAPIASAAPSSSPTAAADARLRGYIEAWLLYERGIGPQEVQVRVEEGVVTLEGSLERLEDLAGVVAWIASLEGVSRVVDRIEPRVERGAPRVEEGEKAPSRWKTWFGWLRPPPGRRTVRFPIGDLFAPPLADQKQPRSHTTWQRFRTDFGTFDIASVGFGDSFGLLRRPGRDEGDGLQLSISGAVFAIFNLDAESFDLLNADYIVGFPLSIRRGRASGRLRFFHQSSHLGDEFLLNPQPGPPVERINLSYEAIELLGSWERRGFRVYGGGLRILHSDTPLARYRAQAGFEYRGSPLGWKTARVVAGLDVQAWQETDWDRDWSAKAGLAFRNPYNDARAVLVLLEYFDGHVPHGQFFALEIDTVGLGVAYQF